MKRYCLSSMTENELLPFLVIYADWYARDFGLDGLHPTHYDLMEKYGVRMDSFKRANNAHNLSR